jgi:predicted dinucleotide-binding enzyme
MPELTTCEGSTTAIIGVGNIGATLARHLVRGEQSLLLASREQSKAKALAP